MNGIDTLAHTHTHTQGSTEVLRRQPRPPSTSGATTKRQGDVHRGRKGDKATTPRTRDDREAGRQEGRGTSQTEEATPPHPAEPGAPLGTQTPRGHGTSVCTTAEEVRKQCVGVQSASTYLVQSWVDHPGVVELLVGACCKWGLWWSQGLWHRNGQIFTKFCVCLACSASYHLGPLACTIVRHLLFDN